MLCSTSGSGSLGLCSYPESFSESEELREGIVSQPLTKSLSSRPLGEGSVGSPYINEYELESQSPQLPSNWASQGKVLHEEAEGCGKELTLPF